VYFGLYLADDRSFAGEMCGVRFRLAACLHPITRSTDVRISQMHFFRISSAITTRAVKRLLPPMLLLRRAMLI